MTLITWNEEANINVKEIDDQHRKLVALVNVLHEVMKSGKGRQVVERALSELIAFTATHFATEEAFMKEHQYPGYAKHKEEHEELLADLANLERRFHDGDTLLPFAIALDLKAWAMNHISDRDKAMGAFLNNKGIL